MDKICYVTVMLLKRKLCKQASSQASSQIANDFGGKF
jgi:hypothetical protein